ncbi:MAG: tyrosine protein phosphatase [Gemmatimonadota bacterium]|nr:tyrosine protein phosphatase [Gemmatimonadota bacterium]MDP6802712.1 tyrosine protein phosphatase [Gemmatimonadota bacterium]MDP7032520.1 tyrosine protein phosphatase [Gemmatimonadota bacterium]
MIDLHCHILPGLDDGAADDHQALAMARAAVDMGIQEVAATSHFGFFSLFSADSGSIRAERDRLVELVAAEGIPLEIHPGAENYYGEMEPAEFASRAIPLAEGPYVLMDFSFRRVPETLAEGLARLRQGGRIPVIAHPERNREVQLLPKIVVDWLDAGAMLQVNASSLTGLLGEDAQLAAETLLAAGAVQILGSDAHDLSRRPFCLSAGEAAAADIVGADAAARMVRDTPRAVLRGEKIEVRSPDSDRLSGGASLFDRMFGRGRGQTEQGDRE